MTQPIDNNDSREPLATLLEQFRKAASATTADRSSIKDALLDELQDAVGMSGKMATEAVIVRRAEKLLASTS